MFLVPSSPLTEPCAVQASSPLQKRLAHLHSRKGVTTGLSTSLASDWLTPKHVTNLWPMRQGGTLPGLWGGQVCLRKSFLSSTGQGGTDFPISVSRYDARGLLLSSWHCKDSEAEDKAPRPRGQCWEKETESDTAVSTTTVPQHFFLGFSVFAGETS